jgi:hypothetical protein
VFILNLANSGLPFNASNFSVGENPFADYTAAKLYEVFGRRYIDQRSRSDVRVFESGNGIVGACPGRSSNRRKSVDWCASLIRGKAGTKVRLELINLERNKTNTVEMMRQKFAMPK